MQNIMKMKITLNEQDIYNIVNKTINKALSEGWGRPKPIHYSYDDKLEFIKQLYAANCKARMLVKAFFCP